MTDKEEKPTPLMYSPMPNPDFIKWQKERPKRRKAMKRLLRECAEIARKRMLEEKEEDEGENW